MVSNWLWGLAAAGLILGGPESRAAEAATEGRYAAYVGGLTVLNLDASFAIDPEDYRVEVTFETASMLAAVIAGRQVSRVEGDVAVDRLRPAKYLSDGVWRGSSRRIEIDYAAVPPAITLDPPNRNEREPVPPEMQAGTEDALTALAGLLRTVRTTGRCEGTAKLYDGRRRTDVVARTVGTEVLEKHRWGVFAGPALRCDVEGRQVAGFWVGRSRAEQEAPRTGKVWFAAPAPGEAVLPVRIEADTGWFGTAFIHLTGYGPSAPRVTSAAP